MKPEQFDRLILSIQELKETVGTEPTFSWSSGATAAAAASSLIALALLVLAYIEYRRSRLEVDARLILDSFEGYDNLYYSLRMINDLAERHRESLSKITLDVFNPDSFMIVEKDQINKDDWKLARSTKSFFKGRCELLGKKFFSDNAIVSSLDRAGADLVRKELRALDTMIFYQVKLKKYRSGEIKDSDLSESFSKDLAWYSKLPSVMKAHDAKFGWDR